MIVNHSTASESVPKTQKLTVLAVLQRPSVWFSSDGRTPPDAVKAARLCSVHALIHLYRPWSQSLFRRDSKEPNPPPSTWFTWTYMAAQRDSRGSTSRLVTTWKASWEINEPLLLFWDCVSALYAHHSPARTCLHLFIWSKYVLQSGKTVVISFVGACFFFFVCVLAFTDSFCFAHSPAPWGSLKPP